MFSWTATVSSGSKTGSLGMPSRPLTIFGSMAKGSRSSRTMLRAQEPATKRSSKAWESMCKRLGEVGASHASRDPITDVGSVRQEQIFTSGTASARYLKDVLLYVSICHCCDVRRFADKGPDRPSLHEDRQGIYLIGQRALEQELEELGLSWKGGLVRSFSVMGGKSIAQLMNPPLCAGSRRCEGYAMARLYNHYSRSEYRCRSRILRHAL